MGSSPWRGARCKQRGRVLPCGTRRLGHGPRVPGKAVSNQRHRSRRVHPQVFDSPRDVHPGAEKVQSGLRPQEGVHHSSNGMNEGRSVSFAFSSFRLYCTCGYLRVPSYFRLCTYKGQAARSLWPYAVCSLGWVDPADRDVRPPPPWWYVAGWWSYDHGTGG